jgi:hypothetical protein
MSRKLDLLFPVFNNMPRVLIQIIVEYYNDPCKLLDTFVLQSDDITLIDGVLYEYSNCSNVIIYNKLFDTRDYIDVKYDALDDVICVNSQHIVSFKYDFSILDSDINDLGSYNGYYRPIIDEKHINTYMTPYLNIENTELCGFRMFNNELYTIYSNDRWTNYIYCLNLQTKLCHYVCKMNGNVLFVYNKHIYMWCGNKIICYNKITKTIYEIVHKLHHIVYITDKCIYSIDIYNNLFMSYLDSPNDINHITKYKKLGFVNDTFYVIENTIKCSVYCAVYRICE